MNADIAIVGGGIVGLATAYHLTQKYSDKKIVVLEKEAELAFHQTGNNSGVIHSGLYYMPGSLKAKNCIDGYNMLLDFCNENDIHHLIGCSHEARFYIFIPLSISQQEDYQDI